MGGSGDCSRQQRGIGDWQESIAMLVERSLSLDWDIQVQVLRSSTLVGKNTSTWVSVKVTTGTAFLSPVPSGEFEGLSTTIPPPCLLPYV